MGSDDPAWGPQLLGVPRPPAPQYGPAWGHGFAGDTRKIAGEYPTQGPKPTTPLARDIPRQCLGPYWMGQDATLTNIVVLAPGLSVTSS